MRTAVYVDGFNLYHSALEARPQFKWLDLHALAVNALPDTNQITLVRYFTARVKGGSDASGPNRQDTYVRALQAHVPNFSVVWGKFVERSKWRRLCDTPAGLNPPVIHAHILHREEKGSDVSLAAHMINDAWLDLYDCAALITNDSDHCEALKLVRARGKQIVLLSPAGLAKSKVDALNDEDRTIPNSLKQCVDHVRHLTTLHLRQSQLPDRITRPGRSGQFYLRPLAWTAPTLPDDARQP